MGTRKIRQEEAGDKRFVNIEEENRELIQFKEQVRNKTASKTQLQVALEDIEEYFENASMPSLDLYAGKYSGEILDLLFENYPEMFLRDRYVRLSKETLKHTLTSMYKGVMGKVKTGDIRASQIIDFAKYVERFLVPENDMKGSARLTFSLQTTKE